MRRLGGGRPSPAKRGPSVTTECPLLLLLLGLTAAPTQAQQQQPLSPLGSPLRTHGSTEVHQMAFDPTNRTLYLADYAGSTIIQVTEVSSAPLAPLGAAPWAYAIVAGQHGIAGPPNPLEVLPSAATFHGPTGVVGWPQYAVGPTTSSPTFTPAFSSSATPISPSPWVGLWIADNSNHALRFIQFYRANNVTLVAGSPSGASGTQDGIGAAALLYTPRNVAWGRFLRSVAAVVSMDQPASRNITTTPKSTAWTSVVFWTDCGSHCLRQGVPFHNNVAHSPLEDITSASLAAMVLPDMILNVSTFAGVCGSVGSGVGLIVPWSAMFGSPWGIALGGLPTTTALTTTTTTAVLFVGDWGNGRVSMIAPMYPAGARTLTVVYSSVRYAMIGVTIGRLALRQSPSSSSSSFSSTVVCELIVSGYDTQQNLNLSIALWVNRSSNEGGGASVGVTRSDMSVVAATIGIPISVNTAFVRYSSYNGTLVVFSGLGGDVLEFYCCLDGSYSDPLVLGEDLWTTGMGTVTWSKSDGSSGSRSGGCTSGGSRSPSNSSGGSGSRSRTVGLRRSSSLSLLQQRSMGTYHHAGKLSVQTTTTTTTARTDSRRSSLAAVGGTGPKRHTLLGGGSGSASLGGGSVTSSSMATTAGVAVSTMIPSASTKAAVAGRTAVVWRCGIVGPAQAAATDPQQFLSFGLSLGSNDAKNGMVRGALILTSCLRVGILLGMMIVAKAFFALS